MNPDLLKKMLAEDQYGLLASEPESVQMSEDERLIEAFAEITDFVRENDRLPERNPARIGEARLAMRLKGINEDETQRELLKEHDALGLLIEPEPPTTVDEALASDPLGLLKPEGPDIFELKNVPEKVTTMPEEISQRKPAPDFEDYEPLFERCDADLKSGERKTIPFKNEQQIDAGRFYVLRGVVLYVAEVGERSRESGKTNARLRCIFENGTESNMLLRSLAAELYKDGRRITEPASADAHLTLEPHTPLASVYVLRSRSEDPQLAEFEFVHKIGSTSQKVEDRVSGAGSEATFLGAPVELVAEYKVPKGSEAGFEKLLHKAFSNSRLDIWFENDGKVGDSATEWFAVPLTAIDQAMTMIESGSIVNYRWNQEAGNFELKTD